MQILFSGKADASQDLQMLVREFDSRQKGGMLRSAMEVSGQGTHAQLSAAGNDKVGSVSGLCIFGSDSVGEIMQIAVQIVPRTRSTISREVSVRSSAGVVTPYVGYWRNWSASERFVYETISDPIVFEDYGPKDDQMTMSAIEAYRWLCKTFPSNMQDRAVHIAFHHLKEGKRGDSVGAAMALAAFSTINGCPVRSDVAITGSIRSDGSVLGVGGIFEKIRGAVAAPYVEVIIIPRDNEGDAMMVPFDDLCRIVVVSAEDMATYMNYATKKDYRQEELKNLRKAQIHLLTGQRDRAEPLLLEVAAECPENFTARRLLSLLAFSRMTGRTGLASAKSP
jgi:predicted ATP-dependent protease